MNKLNISLIGVPMDLGQARRGVDMGPSAFVMLV
jgi:arginase